MSGSLGKRLLGKIAIITGAGQGMGAAHAKKFVAQGAKVILTDINVKTGSAVADSLGENAIFVKHDTSNEESWANVVSEGEKKFGTTNVLIHNAGVLGPVAKSDEMKLEDYYRVCAINQHSAFLGMRAVLPSMKKYGSGSIVNVSSIAGIAAVYGAPNFAYVASKFAVRGMSKAAAVEYGPYNIRVNSLHPGFIKTPMMANATDEEGGEATKLIPLGRLAEPDEVADLAVFLASEESTYITGTELIIDGGLTSQ